MSELARAFSGDGSGHGVLIRPSIHFCTGMYAQVQQNLPLLHFTNRSDDTYFWAERSASAIVEACG